ncbi:hypothetical protein [Streptomyces sp. NPDC056721]|uniref:hypothetical protein n=1 Tax=unclassified Streptomyces TaxID=2593676 RepID=UPI0036A6492E
MLLPAALCVPMGVAGAGAGRDRQLDDEHTANTLAAGARAGLRPLTPHQLVCSCDSGCSYDVRQCVRASARRKG